jgi:iron complex outermembrane receptor protein
LTNDVGEYQLRNVPAGSATLQVSYTGIEATTVQVTVGAGTTTLQDVTLAAGGSVGKDGTVMLDPFTIESGRFKNATDIAINEERYSVNIKNVVAADAFGDIPGGNVGEFIKFLPGVEITYGGTYTSETDASGISVRGFGTEDTAIYIDGVPISSASPASLSNAVGLDMMSINNASRVELVKVATPDMPNNSIGGSINLISKSAFRILQADRLLEGLPDGQFGESEHLQEDRRSVRREGLGQPPGLRPHLRPPDQRPTRRLGHPLLLQSVQ